MEHYNGLYAPIHAMQRTNQVKVFLIHSLLHKTNISSAGFCLQVVINGLNAHGT